MKNTIFTMKKNILALVAIMLFVVSCTDNFYEYNKNPDEPGEGELPTYIKLGNFLVQMQDYVIPVQENAYQHGENLLGHVYGRYLASTNEGWSTNFASFNANDLWLNSPFKDTFTKVYGGWSEVKKISEASGPNYAWAQILRVAAMQRMADIYGPIPYSNISKGTGSITVAYDSQEAAYKNMLEDLDNAITELTTYVSMYPNDRTMEEFDQVYGGDFSKWVKFANSLKLRMAMRIVYADATLAKTKTQEAINHPIGVITDNMDNAMITSVRNPLYVMWSPYSDCRAAADLMTYLQGYADPRLEAYFSPGNVGGSGYYGLRVGIEPHKNWSTAYSAPNVLETDRLLWFSAAEVAFLRAEGAFRNWENMGGTAESFYREGVRLSFDQYKVTGYATYIEDNTKTQGNYTDTRYPASAVSTITIKWDEAASNDIKLERIMTQKWIALYPLGTEAWSEQRRTGYPRFFQIPVNKNSDGSLSIRFASRIPFPPDERLNNKVNYDGAVGMLGGGDNYSTRLWWDKNPNKPNW